MIFNFKVVQPWSMLYCCFLAAFLFLFNTKKFNIMHIRRNFDGLQVRGTREPNTVGLGNTVQDNPSLEQLLIMYQNGKDIDGFIRQPATNRPPNAPINFDDKVGKVDFLTETEAYIKKEAKKAQEMLDKDKQNLAAQKVAKTVENEPKTENTPASDAK